VASLARIWPGRSGLARDLHDGVGQSLIALLIEIRVALDRGEAGPDDLVILERQAENALHAVRALAYRVRQHPAEDPLADARRYGEHLLTGTGGALHWIDERPGVRMTARISKQVAWSIRESITNAVRHGRARNVEVRLRQDDRKVLVTVRDDGVGFSPEAIRPTADGRGLGLIGNAERMLEVGGAFTVRSRPGAGTEVLLEAPQDLRRTNARRRTAAVSLPLDFERGPQAAAAGI
jgi:two-component system, NarL family, sensor histidine kinase UhpB